MSGNALAAALKNVILFIGDAMGAEQIKAAGYYFHGAGGIFNFEQFGHPTWMSTNTSTGELTDSAASATAIATGVKVNSDVVSVAVANGPDPRSAVPSDGRPLPTLLEHFSLQGRSTGLVTNSFMTDATPGAFGAQVSDRSQTGEIASGFFTGSRPNVLLGGGGSGFTTTAAATPAIRSSPIVRNCSPSTHRELTGWPACLATGSSRSLMISRPARPVFTAPILTSKK